jgi:ribose transport system substrate-binding protein
MAWAPVAIASVVLAACSGGSADAVNAGAGAGTRVDAMNPVTQVTGPTEAFAPPSGKRVLILFCGSAGQGCVNEANETKRAAESLGWTVDMVDGKLDPTVWNQVVKQSVESGVDGIIAISADPNLMADAMRDVQAKDIPFVLTNQVPAEGDVAGVDTYLAPDPVKGGKDVADWINADSGGKAHVLLLDLPGYHSAVTRTRAIAEDLQRKCPDCVVHKADIAVQTMGTSLAPLVTSQLQQYPDVDYIWSPDDCCVIFVQQGILQAGRASNVKVVSTGGFPDQLANVRSGHLAADQATATLYLSWLSVDGLARLMAGQPVEKYWPVPQRIWTAANIAEAPEKMFTSGWNTDFDYEAQFTGMWGTRG